MKNKYVKRSKISEAKFRKIIMCFAMELDAQQIAALTSLNRNTINRYIGRIRSRMVDLCAQQADQRKGTRQTISYRPDTTPANNKPAGLNEILPVFGIQSLNTHIYTEIIAKEAYRKLRRQLKRKSDPASISLPEKWKRYHAIVDLNGRWHYQIDPVPEAGQSEGAANGNIQEFLGFARKRLTTIQLNGSDHFNLYLKECEFRFNNRDADLYKLLLKDFRENPIP